MNHNHQYIYDNYATTSTKQVAEYLGMTPGAVKTIACKLGIKKQYIVIDLPGEVWGIHPEYPGILVSNKGRVKTKLRNKPVEPRLHEGYYDICAVDIQGRKRTPRVHKLVAYLFVQNPDGLPIVNHLDGNKLNNDAGNLEWTTYAKNTAHAYSLGIVGKRTGTLSEEQVREVCMRISRGESINHIMRAHPDFTRSRVEKIRQRTRWTHISKDYNW